MINASRPASRRATPPLPVESRGSVPRLRVVDDDVYADWESVYRDNIERLYRLMYARVGNRPDAEDLTSEIFSTAPFGHFRKKGAVGYFELTALAVQVRENSDFRTKDVRVHGFVKIIHCAGVVTGEHVLVFVVVGG